MKHRTWKRWTAALSAAAILFTPLATRAQSPGTERPTTVVNHAIGATATANNSETDYWGADKAIDGIVNRDEKSKENQSRWSTNGGRTIDQVEIRDKVLTVNLGSVKSFDQLVLEWERANVTQFKIEAAGENLEYSTIYEKTDGAEIETLTTTIDLEQKQTAQYVRLTVSGYTPGDINWASVSLWEFEILETVPAENLALQGGVEATADSVETSDFPAAKAIDGDANRDVKPQSRWASAVADEGTNPAHWLALKFPSQQTVGTVILEWERCNATQYQIQYKAGDESEWTTAKSFTQAPADHRDVIVLDKPIQATQLRVYITESDASAEMNPGQSWDNVSIYEFEVYAQTLDQGENPGQPEGNDKPVVIPELAEWTGGQGDFTITDATRLMVNPAHKDALNTAVTEFQADYKDVTGKTISVVEGTEPKAGDFYFTLGSADTDLGEEGYLMKVTDSLTLEAVDAQGVYWGTRSVLQILSQNGDTIPQGTARDYPAYEVRGFMLDVGRKPISYEFLQTILKEMAWYKMNDFQLHLNDNSFQKEYPDATVEIAKKAYSGFRLESTIKAGGLNKADLTSEDMYYTKDQMRTFIQEARALGIDVVPEFDTPAHSLALTKVRPDLIYEETLAGVDHLNLHEKYDETISFVKSIFNEYMTGANPVFDQDTIVHVGTDEYDAKHKEEFRKYTDDMLKFVQDSKRTVRLWGSLSMRPGTTQVRSEGVQMNVWNVGWANPNDMIRDGYDIINTDDTMLYIVPGVTRPGLVGPYYHDYLDSQWLYNNWNPTKFGGGHTVSADSEQLLGATFAVWNDKSGVHSNGITEQDIYDRFADALPALASKMWGDGKDLTYQQLVVAVDKIGVAPNNNPRYEASSVDGQYLSYTFEDGQEKEDVTANNRDITNLHNVETQYGTLKLLGNDSYVETGLDKLGFGNALEFDITLTEKPQPGQILFEADSEYDTHDIRILDDGTLGYTTELYDYSFGYTLPVGETVHLRIESILEHSALIVNGVRHEAVGRYSEEETGLNLTNIGYPSFVLPLQRIGSETNAVKAFIDNVTVSVIPQAENPVESFSATSEYSGDPIAKAFDGNTSTFWHSNWSPYEPLPVSVTINLKGQQTVTGFTYLPRQDGNNNGQVTKYDLEYKVNADDTEWISLVKDGVWQANAQKKTATFDAVQASVIRFTAKEGTGDNSNPAYACAAEFEVLLAEAGANQATLKAYADQGGTATVSPETATIGESATFTATAAQGYQFDGWYNLVGDKISGQATYTMEVEGNLTLIAKFSKEETHTHELTKTEAKAPTCTEDGNIEYWHCDGCGKYFSDANGEDEISLADTVVAATGHKLTKTEAKAPTCTEDGNIEYWHCDACGKYFSDAQGKVEIKLADTVIAATGHHYENGVCTVCGEKDPGYVEPTEKPEPSTQPTAEPTAKPTTQPTDQPATTDAPQVTKNPEDVQTGDQAPLMLYTVMLLGAGACLVLAVAAAKRKNQG